MTFNPHLVWLRTLRRLRRALVTHALQVAHMHAHRINTNKTPVISEKSAEKFNHFLLLRINGRYEIKPVLEDAIKQAEHTLATHTQHDAQRQTQPQQTTTPLGGGGGGGPP